MIDTHHITNIRFEQHYLWIDVDGSSYHFDLHLVSPRLLQATHTERTAFHISPSGYGIHWPLIDEDLSVDALISSQRHS